MVSIWESLFSFTNDLEIEDEIPTHEKETEIRIIKYAYGLWDKETESGFLTIYDKWFGYICCRCERGVFIETVKLPSNSYEFFSIWFEKFQRQGCLGIRYNRKLYKDFWTIKNDNLIFSELNIIVNEEKKTIQFVDQEPLLIKSDFSFIPDFENFNLLGL
jgi:hypothetical protein